VLTFNQEKYLLTIPADKVAVIKSFDPKARETAESIIGQIKNDAPNLEIFFGGASALGIAGQNDIDLNLMSSPKEYEKYIPVLNKLFGQPGKTSPDLIKWEFQKNSFDVELYLSDRLSPTLQEQIKTFETLRDNPALLKEYEQLKLASNGLPFREYMRRKYEFFNKILGI
jgi:GrpB protein